MQRRGDMNKSEIYRKQAEFNDFMEGHGRVKRSKAVIYDQFKGKMMMEPVRLEGTKKDILAQYRFFKECYPDRSLAIVCPEFYQLIP